MQFLYRKISLEGHNSFKTLLKKNYKIVQTLQTKTQDPSYETPHQFQSRSRTFSKQMKTLSKKLKYSKEVQLHQALECYRRHEMRSIIKRFQNIRSISFNLFIPHGSKLAQDSTTWFRVLKRLSKLWIALEKKAADNIRRDISPDMLDYFLRKLPRGNISTFKFSFQTPPREGFSELLSSKGYSKKLKNLILIHQPAEDSQHVPLSPEILSSSSRMQNLRSLQLSALFSTDNIISLLSMIEKPENFISIQLKPFLMETSPTPTPESNLPEALAKFQNLTSLNLDLLYWKGNVANIFEQLSPMVKLTELKMNLTATKFTDLSKLADAMENLTSLKKLSLRVRSPRITGEEITETCTDIFQTFAGLEKLQRLKIFFRTENMTSRETFNPDHLLSVLSESLLNLTSLESFSFDFYNYIRSYQWTDFFRKARPILINLSTLKIHFKGEKLIDDDYNSFLNLLQNSSHLSQLSLNGFHFILLEHFEKMASCLLKMKRLTRVTFNEVFGKLERGPLARFLNEILAKPGFKEFKSDIANNNQYIMKQAFHHRERVNLKNITNKNFSLEKAYTPLDIFLGNNDVAYWKWL